MVKAIDVFLKQAWAIMPEWMDTLAAIAQRENEFHGNLEALEKKLGRPLGNTMAATVRNGVAIVPIEGPLFARADFFSQISGATSYDQLARDFTAAIEDPSVDAIVLNIDSPGGEVKGVSQLAQYIRDARGTKPIVAFVGGTCASAAYWLAAQADQIIASDTAVLGSIGVQMGFRVQEPRAGEKQIRFVSSNAPKKNEDPTTESGAAGVQRIVDDMEAVFLQAVADGRGTDTANVIENYGQGAVFVAADAQKRGIIDGVGTLEGVLNELISKGNLMDFESLTAADLAEKRPDLVASIKAEALAGVETVDADAIRAEGAAAERNRIMEIEALAMPGAEDLIATLKADASVTPDQAAVKVLKHLQAKGSAVAPANAGANHLASLRTTEAGLEVPAVTGASDVAPVVVDESEKIIAAAQAAGAIR